MKIVSSYDNSWYVPLVTVAREGDCMCIIINRIKWNMEDVDVAYALLNGAMAEALEPEPVRARHLRAV